MSKYGLPSNTVEIENHVGHWNVGTGARSLIDEVEHSRLIAKRVHGNLIALGVPSTYYQDETSTNKNDNLKRLVAHHNADTNGLVVSYHLNAAANVVKDSIGTEVLYANEKWKSLAEVLSAAIAKAGNFKNRGAKKRTDLYVLNSTKEPAILIETFFVNSEHDVNAYKANFNAICNAISNTLAEALGKQGQVNTKESEGDEMLNVTGRDEIRKLLVKAREDGVIDKTIHTNDAIAEYSDLQLLSYQAAVVNRTYKK